jgi:hypothetical protein
MPTSYGTINNMIAPRTSTDVQGESAALLGADVDADAAPSAAETLPDGHASLASSTGNLTNTIIGSGESMDWYFVVVVMLRDGRAGMLTFPMVRPATRVVCIAEELRVCRPWRRQGSSLGC